MSVSYCSCPTPGYCAHFGKHQSPRCWQICRGEVLTPEACDSYRANWMQLAYRSGSADPLGCIHRGEQIGERIQKVESKGCGECAPRGEVIPVFGCALHSRATLRPWQPGQIEAVCRDCVDRRQLQPKPLSRNRIEPAQLFESPYQFNNSLVRFDGRLFMAYRVHWDDARLAIAELDESLSVVKNSWLSFNLGHAQEDPRLFIFRGKLHISFTAVNARGNGTVYNTDVCYASLMQRGDGHWVVDEQFFPKYAARSHWEKNWGLFEYEDQLYAVYSIRPHKILRIDGDYCELVAESRCEFPRKPGLLHGGAPPIYHRGEFYAFYHRRLGASQDKWYTVDLYTFEAKPPFRPSRHVELPLLVPDQKDRPGPTVPHAIFPGGAFLEHNRWRISFGYYDKWSEIAEFDINEIETSLIHVPGGALDGLAYRRGSADLTIWRDVVQGDKYSLPETFSADDVVVDVGAHAGAMARTCLDRGAGYAIAVERDHNIYEHLLKKNLAGYPQRAEPLWHSVGSGDAELPLSRLLPPGGVRLLKISTDGTESELLAEADLSKVMEVVGETPRSVYAVAALLEQRGFVVTHRQDGGSNIFRALRGT